MMVFGPFMVILVPVLIIVISVLVLYRLKIKPPRSIFGAPYQPASEALQILQKRLADGEIDEEEFEARKRVLTA
ncbi:MAG: SHOCT domain-containing protein [Alphaproteobacteria bacterium]|nr:SHOCT domain-containing protein [Alphaproteobacteria bacterium]MBT5860462.1 SHOCT domain-containing protein [Alphaproteobacteria bacterium]